MDDPERWLALAHAPGLHAGQVHAWLAQGAAAPELARQSRATLAALGLGTAAIHALLKPDAAAIATDRAWLRGSARRTLVGWGTPDYPALLARIPDAPLVLYVEGDVTALSLPQLAIVGSRNPTASGRDTAFQFARHLAEGGFTITSGLALGIDAAAHRGALAARARTVAVVGRGSRRRLSNRKPVVGRGHRGRRRGLRDRPAHRHAAPEAQLPAPQQGAERSRRRHARRRGGPAKRLAHHGPARRRARARSLCDTGLHPQPIGAWLPQAVAAGRAPGRDRRRYLRRTWAYSR